MKTWQKVGLGILLFSLVFIRVRTNEPSLDHDIENTYMLSIPVSHPEDFLETDQHVYKNEKFPHFMLYFNDMFDESDSAIVYIPELENKTYRDKIVQRIESGLDVCFLGHASIEELEQLLGITLSYQLIYHEYNGQLQEEEPLVTEKNIFNVEHVNYIEKKMHHDFSKEVTFDLLIYRQSGEDLLVASLKPGETNYMDLLLCVAEENRMHPETYQTSTSGNVQYRLYQDVEENTYFAYDFSLYEEYHYNLARQKSYLYIYHTYFSQQGLAVSLSTGLFDTHRGDLCCWIDMNDQRNQYTDHYGLWCPYLLQTSRMFYIPESKIRIDLLEHEVDPYIDGYQIYFEIKQGTYDHQTVIHPFFHMTMPQYMDYGPMDIADQVTFYPIFKQ